MQLTISTDYCEIGEYINTQKSILFLYIINKQTENKILKINTLTSKYNKYLEINLIKMCKTSSPKTTNFYCGKPKENLNKWKI